MKKHDFYLIGLLILSFFGLFVLWRSNVQKTKQLQEVTKQYQYLVEHPKIEYRQGPTKIVQGPVKIVEKVVIQRSSETITSETITEISTTTVETAGVSYTSQPMIPKQQPWSERTRSVTAGLVYNDSVFVSINYEFKVIGVGIGVFYNWTWSDVKPMVILQYKF
jgi:hypothetical protein